MDFNGEYHLTADRRTVWNALNDINVLREAIPGCEQFTETGSNKYTATINSKIGPVTAKFKTNITVDNIMPEQSYTLIVEGSGGAQGVGQGIADVNLIDKDNETTLAYTIKFNVRGKLAQVGSRLLYNGIEKISKEFFTSLAKGINNSDAEK